MGQMSEHRVSISAGEGGGGLRGAVSSLTPHDLQIETQTGVCAYCFLVLSSRNEYIPDGPVNDAEWAAHQVPLTLSSILLTFCNIHRPQSPSSTIILINLSPGVYIPFFLTLSLNLPDPLSESHGDLCLYNLCLYPIIPDPLSLSFCLLSLTWWCGMMWREKYPTVIGRWEHYASTA